MKEIREAEKKLRFADYLLNRSHTDSYPKGAMKHVIEAANILVVNITGLNENRLGPQVIKNKLNKIDEEEAKEFGKFYLRLWKMRSSPNLNKKKVRKVQKKVKEFAEWIKTNSD